MSLKFSMMLQAIDRVTGPAKRIQNSMKGIGRQAKEMARDVGRVGREAAEITRLDRASRALVGAIGAAGRAAKHFAGRAGLGSWGDAAELAGWGVGRLARTVGGFALNAAKWAGAAGIGAVTFSIYDLFSTAGKFEQFQIMLENTEGSAAKARKAMSWVQDFAQRTPYELDQVMEAFVSLKAYGIDPLDGSLKALGDGAAGMSKPIMQAVEALADAVTGEFERLKEFGIRSQKIGDQVAFTYTRNGKEVRRQVKMNAVEVEKAITGIMTDRFGGMMDRQSLTFAGMISNLKDAWSRFLMLIADAGVFDMVKSKLQQLLEWVNTLASDGTLQRWAKRISYWLEKAFDWAVKFVTETNWSAVVQDIKDVGEAVKAVADFVLLIARNWDRVSDAAKTAMVIINPIGSAVDYFTGQPPAPPPGRPTTPQAATPRLNRPSPLRQGASGYSRRDFEGAAPVNVGGAVKVELVAPNGWGVRTREMKSYNPKVPLLLQYGRSMGTPQ